MSFKEHLVSIMDKHRELARALADPHVHPSDFARLSKEYAHLEPVAQAVASYQSACSELSDIEILWGDPTLAEDMKDLVLAEQHLLKQRCADLEHQIKVLMLPRDERDARNVILEIRPGTGGEEAALFAADLMRMYQRYAESKRWQCEIMVLQTTDGGGLREGMMHIKGQQAFARLKFESGVHRVQRVPSTEASGRIHTSAATVAVLPEAEEVDLHIEEKDLRIDVFRSSGPGGQSVNTTDSAVRVTHIPSGLVVQQQDEKSQHKNKAKALKILRARLYEWEYSKQQAERAANRKQQVGTGDRSERIRTYNFPQGRATEHRIHLTLYKLDRVMDGSALDEFIEALIADDQLQKLGAVS